MKTCVEQPVPFYSRTGHWQELWSFHKGLRERESKRAFSLERFHSKIELRVNIPNKGILNRTWLSGLIVSSKLEKRVCLREIPDVAYLKNRKIFFQHKLLLY
jgi:hypothetical protein